MWRTSVAAAASFESYLEVDEVNIYHPPPFIVSRAFTSLFNKQIVLSVGVSVCMWVCVCG